MIAAIIVLGFLLVGAVAYIFWLLQVLKNTFKIIEISQDLAAGKVPEEFRKAYDGEYYPASVILQMRFEEDSEILITDFSMYKDKKIIGFTICTKETMREFVGVESDGIPDDILKQILEKPTMIKDVIVYAPWEGMWTWKYQE